MVCVCSFFVLTFLINNLIFQPFSGLLTPFVYSKPNDCFLFLNLNNHENSNYLSVLPGLAWLLPE